MLHAGKEEEGLSWGANLNKFQSVCLYVCLCQTKGPFTPCKDLIPPRVAIVQIYLFIAKLPGSKPLLGVLRLGHIA